MKRVSTGRAMVWRRVLQWSLATALILTVAGVLVFKLIEAKIVQSFSAPQLTQSVPQQIKPLANYDFPYMTLDGQARTLSQLKGKVVFVNFWGTWCIRCVAEMPMIQKFYDHFRGDPGVAFVIASRLDPSWRIRLYARHYQYDLPFYLVRDADIPPSMQFEQYPTSFVFAKDGTLAEKQIGGADWSRPSVVEFIHQLEKR